MLLTLRDLIKYVSDYSYFILCTYIYDNGWIITGIVSNKRDIIVRPFKSLLIDGLC